MRSPWPTWSCRSPSPKKFIILNLGTTSIIWTVNGRLLFFIRLHAAKSSYMGLGLDLDLMADTENIPMSDKIQILLLRLAAVNLFSEWNIPLLSWIKCVPANGSVLVCYNLTIVRNMTNLKLNFFVLRILCRNKVRSVCEVWAIYWQQRARKYFYLFTSC
jgi:hypothetical protein